MKTVDNDFEAMCRRLDENRGCGCKICIGENKYLCAKNAVIQYVKNDKNRLMNLKCEANSVGYIEMLTFMITILSMFICTLTLLYTIVNEIAPIIFFVLIIALIYTKRNIKKYRCVNHWSGYIKLAIEEVERTL